MIAALETGKDGWIASPMSANPGQLAGPSSAARIGRWIISAIPFGWTWIPDFGIQKQADGVVPSNIYLREDQLLAGNQLALYIQAQITETENILAVDYPMSAKYFLHKRGLPIELTTRIASTPLTTQQMQALDDVYKTFHGWCDRIGIQPTRL